MKLELLTATVIDDAINFVSSIRAQKERQKAENAEKTYIKESISTVNQVF
jgi:hypothetical protein